MQKLGYCRKDRQGRVLEQNEVCLKLCGNQFGKVCSDGCMEGFVPDVDRILERGIKAFRNKERPGGTADIVLIEDGSEMLTLLFAKDELLPAQLAKFSQYSLTQAEQNVVSLILLGLSRKEIGKKLCVSLQTVKSHLNSIYKKIPLELKRSLRKI